MEIFIIQPPMVQLNTPYPSGAYLSAFFRKYVPSCSTKWLDLGNEVFRRIFCRSGLTFIFKKSEGKALKLAEKFERQGDENSACQLRRYVCESENWINWIDKITAMVSGKNGKTEKNYKVENKCSNNEQETIKSISGREFVHEFVRSAHAPRGMRIENFLAELGRDVTADDSQIVASLALADLADYIQMAYDSNFSLIRYAEGMAVSTATFNDVEKALDSAVLNDFYKEILEEKFAESENGSCNGDSDGMKLFCISVPFGGCFEAGIYTARFLKNNFGNKCIVAMGGGYINTELREICEKRLFDYVDFLSYDKGYGSYRILLEKLKLWNGTEPAAGAEDGFASGKSDGWNDFLVDGKNYYKIRYLCRKTEKIAGQLENHAELEKFEKSVVRSLIPDFSDVDFADYPRLADDVNPMHRIWNDGSWMKVYMAYGCYWHRCAFCDTSLDYVNNYCGTDSKSFFEGIYEQAEKAGVYGLHFVDEACPPKALEIFSLENCRKMLEGKPGLTFWGNIRFEKTFSRDLADLLSYAGMTAVSAGIEIATGQGLETVNKGTDMENIVAACCAFKEAGILIHSYMIFGYWSQTELDLINSMETLRQMFSAGLLDSAFFHKFSLTKYSTVYRDWKAGKIKGLKPVENPPEVLAQNEIGFEGENKSEKYSAGLNMAVESWMHGEKLNKSVQTWFNFKMPAPSISKDFVEKLIEKYEQKRDKAYSFTGDGGKSAEKKYVWLGRKILVLKNGKSAQLCWSFMGELNYADAGNIENAEKIVKFLKNCQAGKGSAVLSEAIKVCGKNLFVELRQKGLCCLCQTNGF